jgi:hypothetical protein
MRMRIIAKRATRAAIIIPGRTRRKFIPPDAAAAVVVGGMEDVLEDEDRVGEIVSEVGAGVNVDGTGEVVGVIWLEVVVEGFEIEEVGVAVEVEEVVGGGEVDPPNVHTSSGPSGI